MTTLPIQLQRSTTSHLPSVDIEAFFRREALRGLVALRLMLVGAVLVAVFAVLGYALFGPGNQHQFFRDIGPVTAFSVAMTFSVAYLGLQIARIEQPVAGAARWLNFWFLAGAGFLLLTFDAPLDLHGRLGHLIDARSTLAQDIGFHGSGDAVLALYMLAGLAVAALYWRELLRHPQVAAQLAIGGFFIAATIGLDGFAGHSPWMWVLEESVEVAGLAWLTGAFAVRLTKALAAERRVSGGAAGSAGRAAGPAAA